MSRPTKDIDQTQFEKLCALQCTKEEIAGWFDCSVDTIENWCKKTYKQSFSAVFSKKREAGKISLRRAQWRLAERSAAMAIFLGKNYLGQHDSVTVENPEQVSAIEKIAKMVLNEDVASREKNEKD